MPSLRGTHAACCASDPPGMLLLPIRCSGYAGVRTDLVGSYTPFSANSPLR